MVLPSRAVPDREHAHPPLVGTTAHARALDVVITHDARTAAGEVDHQCQDAKQGEAAIGMPEGLALLARRADYEYGPDAIAATVERDALAGTS